MRDLFLIGVHESGEYVVLGSNETGDEYRLPLDDAFREAARWETGFDTEHKQMPVLRPAEVQALIRAGASASEAAERAGWSIEKVRRFEGPVLAERGHIAELAGHAHVRGHSFGQGVELRRLVEERLAERDIDPALPRWDSRRGDDGQWIVEVRYPAEHQARVAQWRFSRSTMTVAALNDEARAITDDEQAAETGRPESSAPAGSGGSGASGGYGKAQGVTPSSYRGFQEAGADESGDENLVADLRERAAARIRRRGTRAATSGVTRAAAGPVIMSETGEPDSTDPAESSDSGHSGPSRSSGSAGSAGSSGDAADGAAPASLHADDALPFDAPPAETTPPPAAKAPAAVDSAGAAVDSADAVDTVDAAEQRDEEPSSEPGHTEPQFDLEVEGAAESATRAEPAITQRPTADKSEPVETVESQPAESQPVQSKPVESQPTEPEAVEVTETVAVVNVEAAPEPVEPSVAAKPQAPAATAEKADEPAPSTESETVPAAAPATESASESAPAAAAKPAPRKRAPRATTRRAPAPRTRATSGAAADAEKPAAPAAATPTPEPEVQSKPAATAQATAQAAAPARGAEAAPSAKPAAPATHTKPATPAKQAAPATPTQQATPTKPATPAKSASPATPAKQAAPARNTRPATPATGSGDGSAFSKQPAQPRTSRAKSGSRGRASVPAWDDIMFGAKPGGD